MSACLTATSRRSGARRPAGPSRSGFSENKQTQKEYRAYVVACLTATARRRPGLHVGLRLIRSSRLLRRRHRVATGTPKAMKTILSSHPFTIKMRRRTLDRVRKWRSTEARTRYKRVGRTRLRRPTTTAKGVTTIVCE